MPVNQFTYSGTTVSLGQNPISESSQEGQAFQATGLDSAGSMYVYDKARIICDDFRLVYPRIPSAVLDQLLLFQTDSAQGNKNVFTFYDHEGTAHSVRMVGDLKFREVCPGEYRVEISLEKETAWTPATDTDLLTTYAAPAWILKMVINSITYYFADSTLYIPSWGITTKPWIKSWGSIQAGVDSSLGEYQVADLSVSLLTDPSASPNIETLALNYPLESSKAELYLYDCAGSAAPIKKFSGYVRDVSIPDETSVDLVIEDESSRLQSVYIGRKLSKVDYPGADPDDVGKVIPVVYGFVQKVPAVCVLSGWSNSLTADIDAVATLITLSELPSYPLIGKTIIIDAEKMTVTAQQYNNLTVTRGASSTSVSTHIKGAVVLEVMASPLVYIAADHPVGMVGAVFARVNGVYINITSACGRYIGTGGGNDYSGYAGKAVVTIPDIPAVQKLINLTISEVGHNHNSATSTTENTTSSLPMASSYYANYPQPTGWPYTIPYCYYTRLVFPSSGGSRSSCSYSVTFTPKANGPATMLVVIAGVCKWSSNMNFVNGSPFTVTFTANAGSEANANQVDIIFTQAGGDYFNATAGSRQVYLSSTPSTYSVTGASLSGNSVSDTVVGDGLFVNIHNIKTVSQVFSDLLTRAGDSTSLTISGGSPESIFKTIRSQSIYNFLDSVDLTGFITGSGGLTIAGQSSTNGLVINSTAADPWIVFNLPATLNDIDTMRITFKRLSGSSTWDGHLYWSTTTRTSFDESHRYLIPQPANLSIWNTVEINLDAATGGSEWSTSTVDRIRLDFGTQSGDSYAIARIEILRTDGSVLNGVINEYRPALYWLNKLAFELRSWFRYISGVPTLIIRPNSLTPTKTLSACRITNDGRKIHSRKKADISEIINSITAVYNRDWSKNADPYLKAVTVSDSSSIATYGAKEKPELFQFDFVTSPDNAQILVDFYLANYKDRHWIEDFEAFLDQHNISFSDILTLAFSGGQVGQVLNIGLNPGDANTIDSIKFKVLV